MFADFRSPYFLASSYLFFKTPTTTSILFLIILSDNYLLSLACLRSLVLFTTYTTLQKSISHPRSASLSMHHCRGVLHKGMPCYFRIAFGLSVCLHCLLDTSIVAPGNKLPVEFKLKKRDTKRSWVLFLSIRAVQAMGCYGEHDITGASYKARKCFDWGDKFWKNYSSELTNSGKFKTIGGFWKYQQFVWLWLYCLRVNR